MGGAKQVKKHRFFTNTNWNDELNLKSSSPWTPSSLPTNAASGIALSLDSIETDPSHQVSFFTEDQWEFNDFKFVSEWARKIEMV
jgi:hypothetical protein